jgi:ADP-ribosylglycohydrolase
MNTPRISMESRVLGCWRGKSAGGTLGLPAEGKTERQAYTFYDPIPTVVPPNDDLELQLVWLDRIENHRGPLTIETIADAWLAHIHYMWDEYGRARWNLRRGVPAALTGVHENPFASGMGSPIRSEIWAIVAAGKPDLAENFARLDSMIDHGSEGIAGEVFFAVLQSLILGGAALAGETTGFAPSNPRWGQGRDRRGRESLSCDRCSGPSGKTADGDAGARTGSILWPVGDC